MQKKKIPKKNGTFRLIYVPNSSEKAILRSLLPSLELRARQIDYTTNVSHAFSKKKM